MKHIGFLATTLFFGAVAALAQDGRSIYHVFPQFVDGRFNDGTFYRSALMWSNVPSTATSNACVFSVRGVNTSVQSARSSSTVLTNSPISFNAAAISWDVLVTVGTGSFQVGYAGLACAQAVNAQIVYSFHAANGTKLSEATVLSIPPSQQFQLLVDERGGAHLGLALANDNDNSATIDITVFNAQDTVIGATQIQIPSRGQIARFLNEFVTNIPAEFVGRVSINSTRPLGVTGLRFTGASFTTIPPFARP
jgi:hypothetical protein